LRQNVAAARSPQLLLASAGGTWGARPGTDSVLWYIRAGLDRHGNYYRRYRGRLMNRENDIQALIALEERRCRAEVESDVATLDSLLDDDFVYIHLSGGIDDKEKLLASRATIKFPAMKRHELKVHVSDDLAVITGRISFQNKMVDSPILRTVEAYVTQALARRGSQWKYIIHQVTLLKMTTNGDS
jgi:hypothetical protein